MCIRDRDFPWAFSMWANDGLSILPERNLVTNIGFGADATHTKDPESKLAGIPTSEMSNVLHPLKIRIDDAADRFTWNSVFKPAIYRSQPREPFWKKLNLFGRGKKKQSKTDAA